MDEWRSSLSEKFGWYYGSSDDRGGSERCHTMSEAGEALEESTVYKLWLGLFYTQQEQSLFFAFISKSCSNNNGIEIIFLTILGI